METENGHLRKTSSILKKLERYITAKYNRTKQSTKSTGNTFSRSRSWEGTARPTRSKRHKTGTPSGCFSVYVGPSRQRFVVKTESANHPLFRMLLEDAELEYGFRNQGPLLLPCEVDIFCSVLAEMDAGDLLDREYCGPRYACGSPFLIRSRSSYERLVPPRELKVNW